MQQKPFLSICIATYNRAATLMDLLARILKSKRTDIEIVITDNASTDDTVELLKTINDSRLRICVNDKNIGGAKNSLRAIYNACGKYALYCNDRDLIGINNLDNIIDMLKNRELSFAYLYGVKDEKLKKIEIYTNVVDSFLNQTYTHHITGMIFNRELISEKNISYNELYNYNSLYILDFLAQKMFIYLPTGVIYDVVSIEREKEFKINNKSCFKNVNPQIYFMPDVQIEIMQQTLNNIDSIIKDILSEEDRCKVLLSCCKYFYCKIINYKVSMNDKYEAAHYGFELKYISNSEIRKLCKQYKRIIDMIIVEKNIDLMKKQWNKIIHKINTELLLKCIKYDLKHFYKRENNDTIF